MPAYVFGYGSLVALGAPGAILGRVRDFRRRWGVAMNNWEGGDAVKHFLDRETGVRPRIRVVYLDMHEWDGAAVNGLALPVDRERLAELDAREVNYERIELTDAFEPIDASGSLSDGARVFAYLGLEEARERRRRGAADGDAYVSREYAERVRRAFARLGPDALPEFDRTTDPLPFPERDLQAVHPRRAGS